MVSSGTRVIFEADAGSEKDDVVFVCVQGRGKRKWLPVE